VAVLAAAPSEGAQAVVVLAAAPSEAARVAAALAAEEVAGKFPFILQRHGLLAMPLFLRIEVSAM
jgi:hypothetical protein